MKFETSSNSASKLFHANGFADIVIHPCLDALANGLCRLKTIHLRHLHVHENHVVALTLQASARITSIVMNIRSIHNKMNAFDEDDYNSIRKKYEAGAFSQQVMEEKFKVYDEFITFVRAATEYNEQILLKLDKLLLEISDFDGVDPSQLEQMAGMIEIDNLIKQAKYYKN